MAYRYEGKADRFDRKHGKLRRQLDAGTRKAESKPRACGHSHTDRGYTWATATNHRHKK